MKLIKINVAPVFSIRIGVYAQRWGTQKVYRIHHHNLVAEVLLILRLTVKEAVHVYISSNILSMLEKGTFNCDIL